MSDFLKMQVETAAFSRQLSDIEQRQLPYATSQALNTLAFRVRDAERAALDRNFTIAPSVRAFVAQRITVTEKATKERLSATVALAGKRTEILARHEEGGTFTARGLSSEFFVPSDFLRPANTSLPPRALYPANLRLAPRRAIEGGTLEPRLLTTRRRSKTGRLLKSRAGGTVITDRRGNPILFGKRGTFLIQPDRSVGRGGGVYQRTGPHRGDVQRLWLTVGRISLPARLHYEDTWRVIVADGWDEVMTEKLAFALSTAR